MAIVMRISCAWTILAITIFGFGNWYVNCTVCINATKGLFVPVVRFCTDDAATGNPVVMDGFNANGLEGTITCKCAVHISHQSPSALTLSYKNAYDISPIQNVRNCGSSVVFTRQNVQQRTQTCKVDGSMPINPSDIDIDIYLQKDKNPNGDSRYCFKLTVDKDGALQVTCHPIDNITASTVDIDSSTVTSTTRIIVSSSMKATDLITSDTSSRLNEITTTQQSVNETNGPKRNVTDGIQNVENDHFKLVYVAIGCGTVGGLILIITVLCLIKSSRRKKMPSRELDGKKDDSSEYGLQYNSLYVSTDNDATPQNGTNQRLSAITLDKNQVEYSAGGNYSEKNLDGKQSTEKQAKSNLGEGKNRGFIKNEGNYSEVNWHGNQENQSSSHLTHDQPKANIYSGEMNENFEMTSTNTIDASSSSTIKDVTFPNGSGCEYAVVAKHGHLKGGNDVYAVVDKTSKRNT